jgi:hypothetical protein
MNLNKSYKKKIYLKKGATRIDIKKPNIPIIRIPMAETFEIVSNSFLVGFLKESHTRLH